MLHYPLYFLHVQWDDLCGFTDDDLSLVELSKKGVNFAEKPVQFCWYALRVQSVQQFILRLNHLVIVDGNLLLFGNKSLSALVKLYPARDSLIFH